MKSETDRIASVRQERQSAAVETMVTALAILALADARLRPVYGAIANAHDGLAALEAGADALSLLANIRCGKCS